MSVIDRPAVVVADVATRAHKVRNAVVAGSAGIATGLVVGIAIALSGRWT